MPQNSDIPSFVRGFLRFIDESGVSYAVLHGGQNGFDDLLSDVDIVVEKNVFCKLASLINKFCQTSGWQLCQVLRHETTAAFFVCSCVDDPSKVVALDICSDYQRNGTQFLNVDELLLNRNRLPWGGYCLSELNQLKYRFAKAAAKRKSVIECASEFAKYSNSVRDLCTAWLRTEWGVDPHSWSIPDLERALSNFVQKSNSRPTLFQAGSVSRIIERIIRPSGLVLVAGVGEGQLLADEIIKVFSNLYFRKAKKIKNFHLNDVKNLVSSYLLVTPSISGYALKIIPSDCFYVLDQHKDFDEHCKGIASHLQRRCAKREMLSIN